ncbi:MAG: tyrosyl-tRNA synthetase [Candidatus Midichloriaceae bacterium]|jgi:tyrosyl-tRNA synthetase|nr:tyrosyl-tRNA synthetase [Candidatus Midichloriaceae bacterium]
MVKSDLLKLFEERGYLYQATNLEGLDELASKEILPGYIGFDCTGKSLHVGSLVQIMMLRNLQKAGHKPIVIMGGSTTKIGDPSGKDETRQMLTLETIQENKQSLMQVFKKFLKFGDGPTDAIMVDNSEWLEDIKYIDFLGTIGRHFTINRMMTFDSVKLRLEREQPLTFLEFNYMLLQAYDFVELNKRYGCKIQMGGSDQWGNIVSGVELGRRLGCSELFGITSELITTKSGAKMGKTASGAVWLNSDMLSPYDYWQFWRNTEDEDVVRFLKLFTELSLDEINRLSQLQGKEINDAKIILANEATKLCHGLDAAKEAHATAIKTFTEGGAGGDLPIFYIDPNQLHQGVEAFKLFHLSGLCESLSAARRLIKGKGAKVNNVTVENDLDIISSNHLENGAIKLSSGQKKHLLVKAQ